MIHHEAMRVRHLDHQVHVIASRLESILTRVGSCLTEQEADSAGWLEWLEAKVDALSNTVKEVCEMLGVPEDVKFMHGQYTAPEDANTGDLEWIGPRYEDPEATASTSSTNEA